MRPGYAKASLDCVARPAKPRRSRSKCGDDLIDGHHHSENTCIIAQWLRTETTIAIKEKKTESELIKLLMDEVGKVSGCDHIISVAIIRPLGQNWGAAWKTEGNEIACRRAFEIARELQSK